MWLHLVAPIAAAVLSASPAAAPAPAARPAAAAAPAAVTVLHGKSADVALDTSGFEQTLPAGSLGGTYERLGQFGVKGAAADSLVFSVLVDSPPADFDLPKLKGHVLGSYRKRIGDQKPALSDSATPPGFVVEWVEPRPEGKQWNLYFEALQGGRWLEVHFSAMGAKPEALPALRAAALQIVSGLQFTPKK